MPKRVARSAPAKSRSPQKRKRNRSGRPSVTTPVRSTAPKPMARILRNWALKVALGTLLGGFIAGFFLWSRAIRDVDHFLSRPPLHEPALLLSAPIHLIQGQALGRAELRKDLLAAQYERVSSTPGNNQYVETRDYIQIKTAAFTIGDKGYASSDVKLWITENRIERIEPVGEVTLRPTILAQMGGLDSKRTAISLANTSPHIATSVLGMEDHRFREHGGIDPIGILRALFHNITSNRTMHGGSTITQQLAKNLFLSQQRTLQRKVREVFFAAALEHRMTKDEILEFYLSEVYLGQVGGVPLHGIESASRMWFGTSASNLSLSQSALIAGIISSPNAYSPTRHPEVAKKRRDIVLKKLARLGRISERQAENASNEPIDIVSGWRGRAARAPWAMDAVIERVEQTMGPDTWNISGLRIHTTIQPHLQRLAQRTVSEGLQTLSAQTPLAENAEAALVSLEPSTGHVVALVGGKSYFDSPFNRATNAWRQAGSVVKPLLLLSAMNRDATLHPATKINDEPLERTLDGKIWAPQNADRLYLGPITVRKAIESSRNIPAVLLSEQVGLERLKHDYTDFGLSRATSLPSSALGAFPTTPIEAASAYTIFPNGGYRTTPVLIDKVVNSQNEILWKHQPKRQRVSNERCGLVRFDPSGCRGTRHSTVGRTIRHTNWRR